MRCGEYHGDSDRPFSRIKGSQMSLQSPLISWPNLYAQMNMLAVSLSTERVRMSVVQY